MARRKGNICGAADLGRSRPPRPWLSRLLLQATPGCPSAMRCKTSAAPCWCRLRLLPARLSTRGRRRCACSIPRWRRRRVRWAKGAWGWLLSRGLAAAFAQRFSAACCSSPSTAGRVRRLFRCLRFRHLHHGALRPVQNRTGRTRIVVAGPRPDRALSGLPLSGEPSRARGQARLRSRRRRRAPPRDSGAPGLDPMARAAGRSSR